METMKRLSPIGAGVSALLVLGFFSTVCTVNPVGQSVSDQGTSESASIAIQRSQVVDPETGSIIYVSNLKRN